MRSLCHSHPSHPHPCFLRRHPLLHQTHTCTHIIVTSLTTTNSSTPDQFSSIRRRPLSIGLRHHHEGCAQTTQQGSQQLFLPLLFLLLLFLLLPLPLLLPPSTTTTTQPPISHQVRLCRRFFASPRLDPLRQCQPVYPCDWAWAIQGSRAT